MSHGEVSATSDRVPSRPRRRSLRPVAPAGAASGRDAVAEPHRAAAAGRGRRPVALGRARLVLGAVTRRRPWRRCGSPCSSRSAITAINVVIGTLIAWVLVRDEFLGKRVVNAIIDLPFALPTIVAGITLLALYGEARHRRRLHESGRPAGAAVRDAAVRRPVGAARAHRAGPGDGGGGRIARREPR